MSNDRLSASDVMYKIADALHLFVDVCRSNRQYSLKSLDPQANQSMPVTLSPKCVYWDSAEDLLDSLLGSKRIFVYRKRHPMQGASDILFHIDNPFYGMSIEEAMIKLDLEKGKKYA